MKRILAFLFTILFALGCSGCGEKHPPFVFKYYTITEQDSRWYITIEPSREDISRDYRSGMGTFASVSDIRKKFISGKLSNHYLDQLWLSSDKGTSEIWNLNELYDAALPENIDIQRWFFGHSADSYYCEITGDCLDCGLFKCMRKEVYDSKYSEEYDRYFLLDPDWHNDMNRGITEDRNATIYLVRPCKYLKYELCEGDKRISVIECYTDYQSIYEVSKEDTLSRLWFFIEENGTYAMVTLLDLVERPSEAWLLSFGLKPLK